MTPRNVWLVITSFAVGPAFGGVTFMVLATTIDAIMVPGQPRGPTVASLDDYWPILLVGSYVLGAIPGIVSALAMIGLTRWLPTVWQRLLASAAVGGAISAVGLSLLLVGEGIFTSAYGLMVVGAIAASGAVAGIACVAIVELFHPLPPPTKVTV